MKPQADIAVAPRGAATGRFLLADIGGTNARFTIQTAGRRDAVTKLAVADFPRMEDALRVFLAAQRASSLDGAVLAVAGPVDANRSVLTNSGWVIDGADLQALLDVPRVRVVNDFEAVAWSLRHLPRDGVRVLNPGLAIASAPFAVLGPGTGLGVACLVPSPSGDVVITTEGGHVTLPSVNPREDAVLAILRKEFDHVSAERAVSGTGLVNLYKAMAALEGVAVPERDGAEITEAALAGTCRISEAALEMFCAMLGTIAGNLALTIGARGGIYIAGGIAPRIVDYLARSPFLSRFKAKGRFEHYLSAIPVSVIVHDDPAFIGLTALVERLGVD